MGVGTMNVGNRELIRLIRQEKASLLDLLINPSPVSTSVLIHTEFVHRARR